MSLKSPRIAILLLLAVLLVSVFALQGCATGQPEVDPEPAPIEPAAEPVAPAETQEDALYTAEYKPNGS
ncbi:MAG: hypothetical protein U1E29_10660, partial [Coriobacteriia bacterium]|nr:hypothetical protein [Coriobacteriia bacterium]